jgi:hypothetical protein
MEAMLGISLYSYPNSTSKNAFVLPIIVYTLSSTNREKGRTGSA